MEFRLRPIRAAHRSAAGLVGHAKTVEPLVRQKRPHAHLVNSRHLRAVRRPFEQGVDFLVFTHSNELYISVWQILDVPPHSEFEGFLQCRRSEPNALHSARHFGSYFLHATAFSPSNSIRRSKRPRPSCSSGFQLPTFRMGVRNPGCLYPSDRQPRPSPRRCCRRGRPSRRPRISWRS
jgi:hypothetical protein